MELLDAVLDPRRFIYAAALGLSIALWLLSLVGLTDAGLDADVDVDAELDADAGASGVLHLFGLGMVPLSVLVSVALFVFGLSGVAFFDALGGHLLTAPAAVLLGLAGAAGIARLLRPLFQDGGRAAQRRALVGRIGVLNSTRVGPDFGSATVKLRDGSRVEVSVRAGSDAHDLVYGDRVVLFDYNPDANLYYVGRFDDDTPLPADPAGSPSS